MSIITPNMNLVESTINQDSGLSWEQNLNASLTIIDSHNHTSGYGVAIPPAGLNINSALTFNNNPATNLQSSVFTQQTSLATLNALFVGTDGNLYFNDGIGDPSIQITAGGAVNATSSGIVNGTASAAFSSSVLVVLAAINTPANIQGGSILLGNNSSGSKYLTLSPPAAMAANFSLTLPSIPGSTQFMTLDASGNMGTASSISAAQIAAGSITGSQIATNVNLPGTSVTAGGQKVVVSNTNGTNQLAIIRGYFDGTHNPGSGTSYGEGWTATYGADITTITFTTPFSDAPVVTANCTGEQTISVTINSADAGSCTIYTGGFNEALHFIAIGQV